MNKLGAEARQFAEALKVSPVVAHSRLRQFVIPAFPYVAEVAQILKSSGVMVGAQNMHWDDNGAWTGEVSPLMLKDCGAALVEIGHSERRTFFNETDETVARKVAAALRHGLIALICIGDTRAEYDSGSTSDVLNHQLRQALKYAKGPLQQKIIFAYEPVWSIGASGVPADPGFVNEQIARLKVLSADLTGEALPVLYGGSVNLENCIAFATQQHIDGLFIGRAAWEVEGYIGILDAVGKALEDQA